MSRPVTPDDAASSVMQLFAQIEEAKRLNKAITLLCGELTAQLKQKDDRINELIRANNEFENRARKAERCVKAPAEFNDLVEMADDLYSSLKNHGGSLQEGLDQEMINYADARNSLYRALLKPTF